VLQQEWQEYGPQAFTWELVTHGYHREEQEAISELFSTTPELLYNQDFKPPKEQPGLQDESSNGGDVVIENPLLRRGFTQIPNAILTGATDFGERKVGLRYVAELCMARMTWD
jgi:hypothetical protein